jgi:hypothetical protein
MEETEPPDVVEEIFSDVQLSSQGLDVPKFGSSLQEVLKNLPSSAKTCPVWPESQSVSATKVADYWRKLLLYYGHASFIHKPTQKELGQWKHMVSLEGGQLPNLIARVVERWDSFASEVRLSVGDKGQPQMPSVDYLTKHLTIAVNWFLMQHQKSEGLVPSTPQPQLFVAKPSKEKPSTSDGPVDWTAIEAELTQAKGDSHGTGA